MWISTKNNSVNGIKRQQAKPMSRDGTRNGRTWDRCLGVCPVCTLFHERRLTFWPDSNTETRHDTLNPSLKAFHIPA